MAVVRFVLGLLLVNSLTIGLSTGAHGAESQSGIHNELTGRWLVVDSVFGAQQAILDFSYTNGDWSVKVVDGSHMLLGKLGAKVYVATSRDAFHLVLTTGYVDLDFRAKLDQGAIGNTLSGVSQIQHPQMPKWLTIPTKLERTESDKIATPDPNSVTANKPESETALREIVARSESLWSERRFAPLHLQLAQRILKEIRIDEFTDEVMWAYRRLTDAATASGATELATEADQKIEELKLLIAQETSGDPKLKQWTPVEVTRVVGKDRVVLFELFTGSSCGACVAADQAYHALAASFQPSELIAIQYHVHIPVPDPLANPDSLARQSYYAVGSAPSTFFNGESLATSGGAAEWSRKKYNQYSRVVMALLQGKSQAQIDVRAERKDDTIQIGVSAAVNAEHKETQRLRIALVENHVTFDGGIGINSHGYVVRAMLGGANGHAMVDGEASVATSISVKDLRRDLMAYLAEYPSTVDSRGKFSKSQPEILLEELSIVAFVQDDSSKDILHAVIVPIR